jgi:uncharacterized SAM-binding protein YcdF (DUF218 family)
MTLTPVLDLLNAIPRNLILPPTSLFLVIAVGLALWRRWPRTGRIVAGSGLAALTFLCTGVGAQLLVRPLEAMTSALRAPERAGAQAIVVLAAGHMRRAPEYEGRDIPDYIALARLRYAAHLQRRTGLPLLVSGGNGADDGHPAPGRMRAYAKADGMAAALREDFGVPVRWIEPRSRDTAENAAFSAEMLRAGGVRRILLVTDAMHMPRAHAVFARAGLDVVDAPTMFFGRGPLQLDGWVPDVEGMRQSWYAIYEWLGLAWYRIRWS